MNREEEIRQAALDYICKCNMFTIPDDTYEVSFIEGATWADSHQQSPWHSVADGDLPASGKCITVLFGNTEDGNNVYTGNLHKIDEAGWFLMYDNHTDYMHYINDVAYWMEIPPLPKESEVKV